MVEDYNANEEVHGILVQLPLPKHIDEKKILDAISLEKDVDGFHPFNIGSLALRGREPLFVSCTPKVPPLQHNPTPSCAILDSLFALFLQPYILRPEGFDLWPSVACYSSKERYHLAGQRF